MMHDLVRVDRVEATFCVEIDRVEEQDIGRRFERAISIDEDRGAIRSGGAKRALKKSEIFARSHAEFENARIRRNILLKDFDQFPTIVSVGHLNVLLHAFVCVEISHAFLSRDCSWLTRK
jgi:uncharacterized protein YlxP (DUF503 family)